MIDVSSWQGDVDWAKAKADGVEGTIIRLGYGWGNDADTKAQRNINECKRLGIPFGIYWYSYAYDANCARGCWRLLSFVYSYLQMVFLQ